MIALLEQYTPKLSKREYVVINKYYGLGAERPHTLEAIAQLFGLSRERVRQIRQKSLKKITDCCGKEMIEVLKEHRKAQKKVVDS